LDKHLSIAFEGKEKSVALLRAVYTLKISNRVICMPNTVTMRLNVKSLYLYSGLFLLLGVWSCAEEEGNPALQKQNLHRVAAKPYLVPLEAMLPPAKIKLQLPASASLKVGAPQRVSGKSNVLPALQPPAIPLQQAARTHTTLGKLRTFPAKGQIVPVGAPEIVLAKDRAIRDQNPFNFTSFGKFQGLKHNVISCMLQDSRGNLWFGSMGGGVCKYDGKYFTHFTQEQGLIANNVTCVLEDQQGNLWFGTDGSGLCSYDGKQFVHYTVQSGLSSDYIAAIAMDKNGKLWIGTADAGLNQFDGKQFVLYEQPGELGDANVLALLIDRSGKLWVGLAGAGFMTLQGNTLTRYPPATGLPNADISAFAEDKVGNIWMGTSLGAIQYDGQSFYHYTAAAGFTPQPVNFLTCIENGELWFGTLGAGAIQYDGQRFRHYTGSEGLNNSSVLCILEDFSGSLWMGTDGAGVSKYMGDVFSHLTIQEGLSNNEVFNTVEDREGNLWFATAGSGVVKYNGRDFFHYTEASGLSENFIYCIHKDRRGQLWLGTNGQGVIRFDGQNFTQIAPKDGLAGGQVLCILEDHKGRLWFGTREGGVTMYDGQYLTNYQEEQGLSSNTVFSIAEDKRGHLWLGTQGGGLVQFDGQRFRHFRTESGLSHDDLTSVICDRKGNLWLGTLGGGLNHFDGQYFTHFTEKEGLSNNFVLSLLQDRKNNLWIGTRFGLSRLNQQILRGFEQTPGAFQWSAERVLFKNYSYEDGFLGIGCWRNSMYEAKNGDIYIGANDRLTVYHPKGEKERKISPKLNLLDISIYNERVPWADLAARPDSTFYLGNGVKVKDFRFSSLSAWNQLPQNLSLIYFNNNLSFRFVDITHQQPEKVKYQYKLEGLENNWTSLSTKNEVAYGNLAPGFYTLRAKALSSTGAWGEEQRYAFTIRPPWWRTGWMYSFYASLLLGLVYWFRRQEKQRQAQQLALERQKTEQEQRINEQLRRVDALKDQFLANTSHELRTPLQGIIGLSESLLERVQAEDQKEDLSMVISSSRRLNSLVNDILDFSKLKNQEIQLVQNPLNLYALSDVVLRTLVPLVQGKKLELRNAVPKELPPVWADENRLQQIFYNLLGNAIKFTDQGSIVVSAELDPTQPEQVNVAVADTGIGIPLDKHESIFQEFEQGDGSTERHFSGTGLGLAVSKKLVELHGGKMWLQSVVGQGSTFYFSLPRSVEQADSNTPMLNADNHRVIAQLAWAPTVPEIDPASQPNGTDVEKVHILVVDDEAINQQVLKSYLNQEVYRLTQVLSGEDALQVLAQDDSLDLVLLDVMMPRMSGYEVCQKIREKYLPNELPIIMITAKNQVADLITGLNTGANDYIAKPFSKGEFLARLSTHLHLHRINAATKRFVPSEFIRALGRESIMDIRLGDHVELVVTVLFADIRDYTGLAESMTPEENFRFVSSYNQRMGPLIQKNQGFINQYLGDGIMAIFPTQPDHALQAAIDIQQELVHYNQLRAQKQRRPIEVGIGLHTGTLIMGIIGDQKRMDAATIADTVNTASRVEGLTKFFGARILLSEDCLHAIGDQAKFHFRHLGRVQVKGKHQSTGLWECFDGDDPTSFQQKQAQASDFAAALNHYFQESFGDAVLGLQKIVTQHPQDAPAQLFLEKAQEYAETGVPLDWMGVEQMKEK
jgi:signal transduction histidine kinase/ligand-binding sensor domain-containing protein/class 3 adenylate cyclase